LRTRVTLLLVILSLCPMLLAEPSADAKAGAVALEKYLTRNSSEQPSLRDASMEVDIEANLPKLNKTGKLRALKHISRLGKVTYEVLSFIGDNTIKKDVIARYLAAEVKSADNVDDGSIAITQANYKFKYRGMYGSGDWRLDLFEVIPRKKRVGLFEGWLWLEADSGLPVRESGRFVRSPSIFLKKIEFMRDYELRDGTSVPVRIKSSIETRLVGTAELTIQFSNVSGNRESTQLTAQGTVQDGQ
jgi:hypothetical protein